MHLAALVHHHDEAHRGLSAVDQPRGNRLNRSRIANENLEPGDHRRRRLVEQLDALQPELHFLTLNIGLDLGDHRRAGFEQFAVGIERVGKTDRLELA